MEQSWSDLLHDLRDAPFFKEAMDFYDSEVAAGKNCFPARHEIFNAFRLTPLSSLKVIILGQDPYPTPGNAMGLAFSVNPGVPVPRSLVNIYKELSAEFPDFQAPRHGCLTSWAAQGVLMLNTVLTVEEGKPNSHAGHGWEQFTDEVLARINASTRNNVYILWGNKAKAKCRFVDRSANLVLESAHPSPLSASRFFGCGHFAKANEYLMSCGRAPVNWQLPMQVESACRQPDNSCFF